MKKLLLLTTIILSALTTFSQEYKWNRKQVDIKLAGVVNFSDFEEDWMVELHNLEMPKPGSQSTKGQLYALKEEARKRFPLKVGSNKTYQGTTNDATPPILENHFEGNALASGVPNDNDIAISNDGIVVSAINSIVYIYNTNYVDSFLVKRSLGSFSSGLGGFTTSKFDPKVAYDPIADRFILVFLAGNTHQNSKIVIAYTQTNDPTEDWNVYILKGNPIDNQTWSDYPVIGINDQELFIGFNTFTNGSSNNSGFVEGTFWQIGNAAGYAGDSVLTTQYYHDILCECPGKTRAIFNVTPIKGGSELYGPNMYLLSSRNLSIENDTVFLMEVTGRVDDPSTELKVKTLKNPNKYFLPPAAHQFGPHEFDTNDSRVLGGFYENGTIQYVQSCMDTTTGLAGVYHGFIKNPESDTPELHANIIGHPYLDLGYPNISYSGLVNKKYYMDYDSVVGDQEAIINVNHTADTVFSGFSAFYYSNNGEYSEIIRIKAGDNYVDRLTSDLERWGDYSGSQVKYNEPGTVWAVGSYGKQNKSHGTWIAQLRSTDSLRTLPDTNDVIIPGPSNIAYPNPTIDMFNYKFSVEQDMVMTIGVYDMSGHLVKQLTEQQVKQGENLLSFSIQPLTAGVYYIRGLSADKEVFKTKIIKHGRSYK